MSFDFDKITQENRIYTCDQATTNNLFELALTYCTVLWGASYDIVIEQVNYPYELAVTYCTVLRGRGDDVVIERVELDVQHHPSVTTDVWGLGVHPPTLQHKGQRSEIKAPNIIFFTHAVCKQCQNFQVLQISKIL